MFTVSIFTKTNVNFIFTTRPDRQNTFIISKKSVKGNQKP